MNDDSYEVDVIEDETIDVQEDLLLNDENIQANENEVLFEDDSVQGFFCHKKSVFCVDVHMNLVATGGEDDCGYVWNVETGDALMCVSAFGDSVVAAKFSHDGAYVAFGSMDGTVQIADCRTMQRVVSLNEPSEVCSLEWHPRGHVIVATSADGTLWMWSVPTGTLMNVFSGHTEAASCVSFTPDGKGLVSIGDDGSLICWNPRDAQIVTKYSHRISGRFLAADAVPVSLRVTACANTAFVGASTGAVQLVSLKANKILATLAAHTDSVEFLLEHAASKRLVTGGADGLLNIWDYVQGTLLMSIPTPDAGFTCGKWLAEEAWLCVTGSTDGNVRVWDVRAGICVQMFRGHQDIILDVAASADARNIVSCSDDGTALVFETA